MKRLLVLAMLISAPLCSNAQWWGSERVDGNGNVITAERNTESYDGIEVSGSFNVKLIQGSEGKLSITADENLIPHIVTEVRNNRLRIKPEEGMNLRPKGNKDITITVPVESISKLALAGSGDVSNNFLMKATSMEVSLAGSGDIVLEIEATELEANIAGSGDIRLSGTTSDLECNIAGSGDIDAFSLKSRDVSANISGSGGAKVYCDGKLDANIIGSGDVIYKGNPTEEHSKAIGSGDIRKAN